jgi:hypothetical protein
MVNVGFVARWEIHHLGCQGVPGHVRELALKYLPYALVVMCDEIGADSEEGGEHEDGQ